MTQPQKMHELSAVDEPPKNQFCHLSKVIEEKIKQGNKSQKAIKPAHQQINRYLEDVQMIYT